MSVQALVFDPKRARLPLAAVAARLAPRVALTRPALFSLMSLTQLPEPARPGPDWVKLRVLACGVCGSDVKELLLQASWDNPLTSLISFPHVPGHELVGQVLEAPEGSGLDSGRAVAVDPWLGCAARGLPTLCPACEVGSLPGCENMELGGPWGPGGGMHLGTVSGLPGGFAEVVWAHRSQCHPLPGAVSPQLFVLADPLAVALHATERAAPEGVDGLVLVIGAGTIGLSLALAARERWPRARVVVTTAWPHQRELVERLGAFPIGASPVEALEETARSSGSRLAHPWRGLPFTIGGGASVVLDSIGTGGTQQLALRVLRPGGRIVVVGVGRPQRFDQTLTYFKEAEVVGSNGYGRSASLPGAPHLLDVALELLAGRQAEVAGWRTHQLPLDRWQAGFWAAANHARSGAVKVVLGPDGAASR